MQATPDRAGLSAAIALLFVAGIATVIAVQSRANRVLKAKNAQLIEANAREAQANTGLREANERVQARFELARRGDQCVPAGRQ